MEEELIYIIYGSSYVEKKIGTRFDEEVYDLKRKFTALNFL